MEPPSQGAVQAWRVDVTSPETGNRLTNLESLVLLQQASEVAPASQALLGLFIAQGIGFTADLDAGKALVKDAISKGYTEAQSWLDQLQ